MRRNRRGMELAVNTLVVLILGVIIVGGGITLMWKIFDKAKGVPEEMNRQQQEQLFSILLNSKDRIAVLNNVQKVSLGDTAIFPVAIQNQLDGEKIFQPVSTNIANVYPDGADVCKNQPDNNLDKCPAMQVITDQFSVKRYESKAFYVGIYVPKKAAFGEYVYNVDVNQVDRSQNLYARTKVHVIVK